MMGMRLLRVTDLGGVFYPDLRRVPLPVNAGDIILVESPVRMRAHPNDRVRSFLSYESSSDRLWIVHPCFMNGRSGFIVRWKISIEAWTEEVS